MAPAPWSNPHRSEAERPSIQRIVAIERVMICRSWSGPPNSEALVWAIGETLGPAFNPEVHAAWREVYALLSAVMRRAAAREPV